MFLTLNRAAFEASPTLSLPNEPDEDDEPLIIPFALVNGTQGIGTGFSHKGLSYNPLELSRYIKRRLSNPTEDIGLINPYYEGFTGEIK